MASKRKRTHTCKKRARTLRKVHRRRRSGGMLMLKALKSAFTKKELKKLMLVNAIYLKSMWIRTGNQENKRIYDAYNDAVVKTSAGRDSKISKDVTTETLTEYRTRLNGLYDAITDPTQKMLVDEDMFNVQQLLQSNPDNANESLRQFLLELVPPEPPEPPSRWAIPADVLEQQQQSSHANFLHRPPPSQYPPPPSQYDPPPYPPPSLPLGPSAPPMDDDPQYPPPPSQYAPPPYPPPPLPLGPSAPPMDPPPPPSYAPPPPPSYAPPPPPSYAPPLPPGWRVTKDPSTGNTLWIGPNNLTSYSPPSPSE